MYRDPTAMVNASKSAGLLGSVASDVALRGDDILGMLKSGKAGDITNEMLDMGDSVKNTRLNQYLFENYDLPMDEASRMARAREMGYDTEKLRFHGGEADITSVNPDLGSGERYRTGFFTSDNPDVADSYASTREGQVLPVVTRRNDGGATIDVGGRGWRDIRPDAPATLPNSVLADEFPELADATTAFDAAPELYQDLFNSGAETNALARQRRFEGDSNITFQNIVDRGPNSKRYIGESRDDQRARELSASQPSEVRVDFYGNQVRSPFARFDPRLSHLSNLTAANASTPAGLLAGQMSSEEQRAIEEYLNRKGLLQ
jgi:hypothetical protein